MLQQVGMAAPSQHLVGGIPGVRGRLKTGRDHSHKHRGKSQVVWKRPLQVGALQDGSGVALGLKGLPWRVQHSLGAAGGWVAYGMNHSEDAPGRIEV